MGEPVLVMLVEDNPDHAELVMRTLADHRVANKIFHCVDGQHVILLDLRLPRVDGLEVLKAIKEPVELRIIPVVVLTTSEAEKDVARAYGCHANSYLVKPVGYAEFSKLMQDLGFYWLGRNMCPQL